MRELEGGISEEDRQREKESGVGGWVGPDLREEGDKVPLCLLSKHTFARLTDPQGEIFVLITVTHLFIL